MASNSSFIQPTPAPTTSRPCDSTSIDASILAASTGLRCGNTITEVNSRAVDVWAARKLIRLSWSRNSPEPPISPLSLYGYSDLIVLGMTM